MDTGISQPADRFAVALRRTRRLLAQAVERHAPVALASSMGCEDMVLIDLVVRDRLAVDVFVLDTGRLHGETYALIERTRDRYGLSLRLYAPEGDALEAFLSSHGPNAFYRSPELRKTCCAIRKIEPLARALKGYGAWITGLRRAQSSERADTAEWGWDAANGLYKYSPLAAWSSDELWDYIRTRDVPYNPLHDQNYPSIGCTHCTRQVMPGEDPRAGRWAGQEKVECGLHPSESK